MANDVEKAHDIILPVCEDSNPSRYGIIFAIDILYNLHALSRCRLFCRNEWAMSSSVRLIGALVLAIHNTGIIAKLFSEVIEAIDPRSVEVFARPALWRIRKWHSA